MRNFFSLFLLSVFSCSALASTGNSPASSLHDNNNPKTVYNKCHVKNNTAADWFSIGWCSGFILEAYDFEFYKLKHSSKANKRWLTSAEKNGIRTFNTKELVNLFSFFILSTDSKELDKMNTATFIDYTIFMFGALHDRTDGKPYGLDNYIRHNKLEFEEIAGAI